MRRSTVLSLPRQLVYHGEGNHWTQSRLSVLSIMLLLLATVCYHQLMVGQLMIILRPQQIFFQVCCPNEREKASFDTMFEFTDHFEAK
jgi:hypothetical protein